MAGFAFCGIGSIGALATCVRVPWGGTHQRRLGGLLGPLPQSQPVGGSLFHLRGAPPGVGLWAVAVLASNENPVFDTFSGCGTKAGLC